MLQKIKKVTAFVERHKLNDVRNLGLIVFAFIVIAVTWSGAGAVQLNYNLQKRIAKIEEENKILDLQNATERLRNEYYKTSQFQELEARRVLGRAAPGERVYVVTKKAALKYVKTPAPPNVQAKPEPPVKKSTMQKNFEDWMDFFFNRAFRND